MSTQLNSTNWQALLQRTDTFLLDCDGVLWNGGGAISGSINAVEHLLKNNKRVVLVTNNSTKSREQYVKKCSDLGFPKLPTDNIITTSHIAAYYFSEVLRFSKTIYLIGSEGLAKELDIVGIRHIGLGADNFDKYKTSEHIFDVPLDKSVAAVLLGFDGHFSYPKLAKAASYLRDPACLFVATNDDETFPGDINGFAIPGTGSLLSSVVAGTGRKPLTLGKPYKPMFDFMHDKLRLDPARTVMIGDRCSTDIKFGNDFGMSTLLVLTGVSSVDDVQGYKTIDDSLVPTYWTDRLGDIVTL